MSATSVDYAAAVRNMTSFIQGLTPSSVKFLFFLASDLTRPKVIESLRSVDVRGHRFYLTPGSTRNFCYAYSRGFVQYVVTPVAPLSPSQPSGSQPRAFNVTIDASGPAPFPQVPSPQLLVEHGKHLDFGLIQTRADGLVVRSHLTNYTELLDGSGAFARDENACNFKLSAAVPLVHAEAAFSGCPCENAPAAVHMTAGHVYDAAHANMLRLLCTKVAGIAFSGGGWKRGRGPKKGKTRRGGSGAPGTFLSAGFVDFLAQRLLRRIAELRPDLGAARVFYDESNEIAEGSSENIVIWYDFEDSASSMYQLDAATVFGAYFTFSSASSASANANVNVATEHRRCWERFEALERALMQAVALA
jgi:hypothetical protein